MRQSRRFVARCIILGERLALADDGVWGCRRIKADGYGNRNAYNFHDVQHVLNVPCWFCSQCACLWKRPIRMGVHCHKSEVAEVC